MNSLQDQLQNLFPDHHFEEEKTEKRIDDILIQQEPLLCKYEKRHGKPLTIIEGYTGSTDDFKKLTHMLKTTLGVGGSCKNEMIIIQGNERDKIMNILKNKGFKVKRVGG